MVLKEAKAGSSGVIMKVKIGAVTEKIDFLGCHLGSKIRGPNLTVTYKDE